MAAAARTTPRKTRRTTKRRKAPRARKAQESPTMPDLGPISPGDQQRNVTAESYAAGRYELEPQIPLREPQESARTAEAPPPATEALFDDEPPPPPPPGGVDANGFPLPPATVRMVHPDPAARADGVPTDETGAILVPLARVEEYAGHGYRIEHEAPT